MIDVLPMQEIAERTAALISKELRDRGLSPEFLPTPKGWDEFQGRYNMKPAGFHLATVLRGFTTKTLSTLSIGIFEKSYLRDVAVDLGIKLSRPLPMATYPQELPQGLDPVCVGQAAVDGINLRVTRAYDIGSDRIITRFDVLASWEGKPDDSEWQIFL